MLMPSANAASRAKRSFVLTDALRVAEGKAMLLYELLSEYEFCERHQILVQATPDRVLEAVKRTTPA